MQAYELRGAGAVMHSHSLNAVMATLIDPTASEFTVTNLEMIKVAPSVPPSNHPACRHVAGHQSCSLMTVGSTLCYLLLNDVSASTQPCCWA